MLSLSPHSRPSAAEISKILLNNYSFLSENENLKGIIDINEIMKRQEIKPSFFQKCKKFYARMTTKSEGWLVSALQENEEGPKEKYVKFLVNKAHEKHEKIDKFFQIVF
jgi:hypothetical protein